MNRIVASDFGGAASFWMCKGGTASSSDPPRTVAGSRTDNIPSRRAAWVHVLPAATTDAASMAERGGRLCVALYRAAVTGCRVLALDAATGNAIWEVPLQGVGMLHHSKCTNRVQTTFVGDSLVVFGDESGGSNPTTARSQLAVSGEQSDFTPVPARHKR